MKNYGSLPLSYLVQFKVQRNAADCCDHKACLRIFFFGGQTQLLRLNMQHKRFIKAASKFVLFCFVFCLPNVHHAHSGRPLLPKTPSLVAPLWRRIPARPLSPLWLSPPSTRPSPRRARPTAYRPSVSPPSSVASSSLFAHFQHFTISPSTPP